MSALKYRPGSAGLAGRLADTFLIARYQQSSKGQFFRSGKRGESAGEVNTRYGIEPGYSFYTHTSDRHAPFAGTVISAAEHEAPFVLDGLLHHGSSLELRYPRS